jgi:hypothetical protein
VSVHVVTVCSHRPTQDYYCYDQFLASLKRYNVEPIILGWEQPWTGLMNKPRRLLNKLRSVEWEKPIIVCDAWDVVFADSPERVVEKFKEIRNGARIMWNAERNLFPDATLQFPETKTSFRYLNSGFSVGYVSDYVKLLESMALENIPDDYVNEKGENVGPNDQLYYQLQFLLQPVMQPVKMALDTKCEIAQTLHGVKHEELDFSGDRIRNIETGTYPLCYHMNGFKELWKDKILAKLGL